jgi:hypothetical protein
MAKHPTTRFIQNKVPKGLIFRDPIALLPQRFTWRWRYTTNYDVTDHAFGMTGNDMNCFRAAHCWTF